MATQSVVKPFLPRCNTRWYVLHVNKMSNVEIYFVDFSTTSVNKIKYLEAGVALITNYATLNNTMSYVLLHNQAQLLCCCCSSVWPRVRRFWSLLVISSVNIPQSNLPFQNSIWLLSVCLTIWPNPPSWAALGVWFWSISSPHMFVAIVQFL